MKSMSRLTFFGRECRHASRPGTPGEGTRPTSQDQEFSGEMMERLRQDRGEMVAVWVAIAAAVVLFFLGWYVGSLFAFWTG